MAQETKLKRKDLKEPDQFLVASNEFLHVLDRNKGLLIGLLAGALLVGGGFLFIANQKKAENLRMELLYSQMTQLVNDGKGPSGDQLITKLQTLFEQFKDGDPKSRAGLLLADAQYRNKRYDDALASFKAVRDQALPGTLNYYLALSGMGHSYESKKDFKQAIIQYKQIIDQPGDFPLFYAYLGLSRCYELSKDIQNAQLTLREMQNKFSEHTGLEKVNLALKRLEGSA